VKILIISQYFWPESFRINDLALALKSKRHDVSILTGLPNYPSGKLFEGFSWRSFGKSDYQGISIYRVPLFVRRQGKPWQLALNYLSFVFFACFLGPILCRKKYDIIFVFEPSPFTIGIPGVLFRRLKKAPMIFWVQDLWPESLSATGAVQSQLMIRWVGYMVRFIYNRCEHVLIQSRSFAEPAIKAGANPAHVQYFPNWAESFYQPETLRKNDQERKEIPEGFCIMFAGNLGEAQSLDTIIRAADKLRDIEDIHWMILGDGRRENWLRKEITAHKLEQKIHLLGHRSPKSMPRYFSLVDVLLVTLRRDPIFSLTIPSKVQSYFACGKPVIGALDGEGAKIINESGAGIAVPAEDADSLAESVLTLYKMTEEERQQMGKRGKAYYDEHFDRQRLLDQLEKLMTETIKEGLCAS